MAKTNNIIKAITTNRIQLAITLAGVAISAFNIYVAYRLAPVVQDLNLLDKRVEAIEKRNEKVDPLIERFFALEQNVKNISENIHEMRLDIKELIKVR